MKLWHVSVDELGYDEYDCFVVRAEDEKQAKRVIVDQHFPENRGGAMFRDADNRKKWLEAEAEEIEMEGEEGIISSSFNAG